LADAESIARIQVASWRAAYRGILPDATLDKLSEPERAGKWREWLGKSEITILLSESDGVITGFASSGPSRDKDAAEGAHEIHAIYVDPTCWRAGHGRALTERTLELAKSKGATSVTLWVLEKNDPARRFYEALGFKLDGGRKSDRIGESAVFEVRYAMVPQLMA
jgi:ribosomal protein S18 acetylase RimI-like enzyme